MAPSEALEEPFRWKDSARVYGPALLYAIGLGAVTPAITTAGLTLGMDVSVAAGLILLLGAGGIIANAPTAVLANRFGERRALIVSAFLGTLGSILAWASFEGWGPLGGLLQMPFYAAAILLIGVAGGGFNLARQSYLTVSVPYQHRARAMSVLGGMLRIGLFVGPFVGAPLQILLGIQGAFAASAVAMGVASVTCFRVQELGLSEASTAVDAKKEESSPQSGGMTGLGILLRDHARVLMTIGLGVVGVSAVRAVRQAIIPLWAAEMGLSPATASIIYGISGFFDLLIFYPSGLWMDKKGRRGVAVACMTTTGLSLVLLPLATGPITLIVIASLLGIGNGLGSGIVMTLGADYAPAVNRTYFLAVWRTLSDFGIMAGPSVLSFITAVGTLTLGVLTSAVFSLGAAAIFAYYLPKGTGPERDD